MLGLGVSRYLSEDFKECFEMECEALKIVRNKIGLITYKSWSLLFGLLRRQKSYKPLSQNGLKSGQMV